jgi:predicted MFS family arabinose efflux permease
MPTYRMLFGYREFRFLYGGQVLSYLGDQLGAVAIAVLVFDRTGSGLLTAVAYAAAWLPGVLGGPLVATLADRLPRRSVMVVCDLIRAGLIVVLVIPGMPLWTVIAVLYAAHLCSPAFVAARAALLPDVLPGDSYVLGNGLSNITFQVCQLLGFAAGGVVVAVIGPTWTLLANAGTFAGSAVLIVAGVRRRPAQTGTAQAGLWSDFRAGTGYILADRWLCGCLLLVWTASAFSFAPEGIAYPYAVQLGGDAMTAGLLLAAPGLGFTVGAIVLTRLLAPDRRDRLLVPAAVLSTAALVPAFAAPDLWAVLGLFAVAGAGASFAAPLNAVFVRRVAPEYRGRAMGVASSGLLAVQGIGFLAAGSLVEAGVSPSTVVGLGGILGTGAVAGSAMYWRKAGTARTDPNGRPGSAAPTQRRTVRPPWSRRVPCCGLGRSRGPGKS